MGLGLYFAEGEGPKFERPVRTAADIEKLPIPDPEMELKYVMDAVRLIRKNLNGRVPLMYQITLRFEHLQQFVHSNKKQQTELTYLAFYASNAAAQTSTLLL
jgi:uroporphyrinogen-III decarboxylase